LSSSCKTITLAVGINAGDIILLGFLKKSSRLRFIEIFCWPHASIFGHPKRASGCLMGAKFFCKPTAEKMNRKMGVSCSLSPNADWVSFRPIKILARAGIARENCLLAAIINATLKVLGQIKPSLLGNTNLHCQHEGKAAKKTSS